MRILLTNDDGIEAPGIATLERLLADNHGNAELYVIAPDGPRSGIGHAVAHTGDLVGLTQHAPDRLAISGTPADCVRLAVARGGPLHPETRGVAEDKRPDWVISGINHGANLGTDTFISGTAAAAREAALRGRPAIAISQYVARHRSIDWARTLRRAQPAIAELLTRPPSAGAYWNVNLPHPPDDGPNDGPDCEWVYCGVDPSPLPVEFERTAKGYLNRANYHDRARLKGLDVDVCLGGRIAISEIAPT
jgi:5'-nucleotidase